MRARRALSSVAIVASSLLAMSCTRQRGTTHEVETDLHNYSVEMQKWEPTEKEIFQVIDDVEESQYTDDDLVLRMFKGVLPSIDQHVKEVAAYRPATAELSDLHDHYRKGWEDLRTAIDAMIAAENKKDYIALSKGKAQMVAARALLLRAVTRMDALMEENDKTMKSKQKS
jgi:hypothetical protein